MKMHRHMTLTGKSSAKQHLLRQLQPVRIADRKEIRIKKQEKRSQSKNANLYVNIE